MEDRELEKRFDRIEGLIDDLAATTAGNFAAITENMVTKDELAEEPAGFRAEVGQKFEGVNGKLDGLQRAIDSGFERHSGLEARVSKIETELHI